MKYITGIHALNIDDSTECCGDWHTSAIQWENPRIAESNDSIFKDYGIEHNKHIPDHTEIYNVANTIRAVLDLLTEEDNLGYLKGFRDDFFCTDIYNKEFFDKVWMLRDLPHWNGIDSLMGKEFMFEWLNYLDSVKK